MVSPSKMERHHHKADEKKKQKPLQLKSNKTGNRDAGIKCLFGSCMFPEKKILKIKYRALICTVVVVHSGGSRGGGDVFFLLFF